MHCGTKKRMKKGMGGKIDGNKAAMGGNEPKFRTKKMAGGRVSYKKGGGTQPMYKNGECPQGKPC